MPPRRKKIKNFKIKWPSFIEASKNVILKNSSSGLVAIISIAIIFLMGSKFIHTSDYFRLRTIESRDIPTDELLRSYKGKNIFKIDLKAVARSLERSYPNVKEAVVGIVLPDKLIVHLEFRKPVAALSGFLKPYPVDDDGVVLSEIDAASLVDLPIILGIHLGYGAEAGKRPDSKNLRMALALLREIKKTRFISKYGLSSINAQDIKNLSFNLKAGPEVKIGSQDFAKRLKVLERTLSDPRLLIDRIKYIDIRFDDVVITPKTAETLNGN